MTLSIGSYHDLEPSQPQPIDRNPSIDCPKCGESHNYQDYWEPRYVDGKDWNPAEVCWLCDECLERMYAKYDRVRRGREHKQLTEFTAP